MYVNHTTKVWPVLSPLLSLQATAAAAQASLLRQQEELERKAADLDRREQALQSRGASTGHSSSLYSLSIHATPFIHHSHSEDILPQQVLGQFQFKQFRKLTEILGLSCSNSGRKTAIPGISVWISVYFLNKWNWPQPCLWHSLPLQQGWGQWPLHFRQARKWIQIHEWKNLHGKDEDQSGYI